MKTNSILSLFLLLCIILCGCTHDSNLPADGTTDAVTETDTVSETAEPQEAETYEITYRIEKVFEDLNYGKPVEVEDCLYERLMILMAAEDADITYREGVEAEARKMGML